MVHRGALKEGPRQNCLVWGDDCFLGGTWGPTMPRGILLVTLTLNSGGGLVRVFGASSTFPPLDLFQPWAPVRQEVEPTPATGQARLLGEPLGGTRGRRQPLGGVWGQVWKGSRGTASGEWI